jgi:hypothetical protein
MYKQAIVVFLDILGFRDMIREAKDDDAKIASIHTALLSLRLLAGFWQEKGIGDGTTIYPIKCDLFSDTVVMSCDVVTENALFWVLENIVNAQNLLIHQNCFARGAVTVGKHRQENNLVFGPALIQAYELEQSLASWPRVIIDPLAFSHCGLGAEMFGTLQKVMLEQDQGGITFINYLKMRWLMAVNAFNKNAKSATCETPPTVFSMHKDRILRAIAPPARRDIPILAKYHALSKFHNDTIVQICNGYMYNITYTKELYKERDILEKQKLDLRATFPELY